MRTSEESDAVPEVKHRHGNSVASLPCAHVNKLNIYITIHKQKNTRFSSYPASKQQNTADLGLQTHEKKTGGHFLW